ARVCRTVGEILIGVRAEIPFDVELRPPRLASFTQSLPVDVHVARATAERPCDIAGSHRRAARAGVTSRGRETRRSSVEGEAALLREVVAIVGSRLAARVVQGSALVRRQISRASPAWVEAGR